jgi:hypothetical protein
MLMVLLLLLSMAGLACGLEQSNQSLMLVVPLLLQMQRL